MWPQAMDQAKKEMISWMLVIGVCPASK